MLQTLLLCHVLAAIGVGPIFTLPLLASTPVAVRRVLILLRVGAGATLLSGILLWVALKPDHALWLYLSIGLYVAVVATIAIVLEPAVNGANQSTMRRRIRSAGIASSALVLSIAALMVLRPGGP